MSIYFDGPIRRGDSFYIMIQYDESTDITGFYHTFSMAEEFGDEPVLTVSSMVGSHPSDYIEGRYAILRLAPEDTALLEPGSYVWDLQVIVPTDPEDIVTLVPSPTHSRDKIKVVDQLTTLSGIPN